jgi:transcriptional/translational regulatory protein YebC/TACO1
MAGHHQWSTVQRLTGALDQKRGQLFSALAKIIAAGTAVAVRALRVNGLVKDVSSIHANLDAP